MKKLIYILTVSFMAVMTAACGQKVQEPFAFTVTAESIEEGGSLPVSVTITKGATSGYMMSARVDAYDISTSQASATNYVLKDGDIVVNGNLVNFEDHGKRDFHIDGMVSGTYMVSVTLGRDDVVVTGSVVAVVFRKDGGGDEPVPVAEKPVSSFGLSGLGLTDGVLILEPGQERRCGLSWSPADATEPEFSVSSTDNEIVSVSLTGNTVVIKAESPGEALIEVSEKGGLSKTIPVRVPKVDVAISSFEIVGLELVNDWLEMEDNDIQMYNLTWLPVDATKTDFLVSSSDENVVGVSYGSGILTVKALYPGTASITISAPDGPSKTFPVRVYKNVKVTIAWDELTATDTQINTKTFPCYLKFSSDSDKAFPEPITWSITMKGVVNVTGRDTQSVTSKQDIKFYGNRVAQYDVTSNVLIPCYSIYRTANFTLSVTLSLQKNVALDPKLWKITYDEKYLTQDVRIKQYLTEIQQ